MISFSGSYFSTVEERRPWCYKSTKCGSNYYSSNYFPSLCICGEHVHDAQSICPRPGAFLVSLVCVSHFYSHDCRNNIHHELESLKAGWSLRERNEDSSQTQDLWQPQYQRWLNYIAIVAEVRLYSYWPVRSRVGWSSKQKDGEKCFGRRSS
jgi:hypothetical protein